MLSINDLNSILSGVATSSTPGTIQSMGGGFSPSLNDIDTIIKSSPNVPTIRNIDTVLASQPQQEQSYTGKIEDTSPLSVGQRAGLSTAGSSEGKKNILTKMGFETLQDQEGNLLVKQGDRVFPVDEKGFSIGDIADFIGGQLPIAGSIVGMVGGAAAAPFTGGVVNPITGGAAGAGIGEFIKQKIAQGIGSKESIKPGEIGIQSAIGGLTAAIPGGKLIQSILPESVVNRLLSAGAKKTIDELVANEFMRSGDQAVANRLYTDLISSELTKTVSGRAVTNIPVGGIIGGVQGGAETAYQGGNIKDIAQGTLYGAGTGALLAPVLGEVFHQGIGAVRRALPEPKLVDRVYNEFVSKNPTPEEVRSFIDSAQYSPAEKQPLYDYLTKLETKPVETIKPGSLKLTNEPISFNELSNRLVSAGYKNAIKILEKMEKDVPSSINKERPSAMAEFTNIPKVVEWLNKELPKISKAAETKATKLITPTAEIQPAVVTKAVLPKELAGAQPRYLKANLKFANDIDKALYVVANQKTKSAAHEFYVDWLKTKFPGETDAQLTKRRNDVKTLIKSLYEDHPGEEVLKVPGINKPPEQVVKKGPLKLTPEQAAIGLQQEVKITPTKETGPLVTLEKPAEPTMVDIKDIYNSVVGARESLAPEGGKISKVADWLLTGADNVMNPNQSTSRFGRAASRLIGRLGNSIRSLGPIGEDVANTLNAVTQKTSQLSAIARDYLKTAVKTINGLSQIEKEELVRLLASNRKSNLALEGRGLYTLEELQSQSSSDAVRKAIDDVFNVTKEISSLREGTPYRDSSGNIVYTAGTPKPYWPTFFTDESRYYGGVDQILLEQRTQRLVDLGQPQEIARANALAGISAQSQHPSTLKIQKAAEAFYNTYEEMVNGGIVVDPADALQRMVSRDSRQAALVDVLGKKGIPAAGEEETGNTPFDIAKRYSNKIKADIKDAIDVYVTAQKLEAKEGALQKEILTKYIDVVLGGADVNEYIQAVKKFNGYKLSTSVFKNFLQPMNNFLNTDFPSFADGFASAYGLKNPEISFKNAEIKFATGKEAAVKSGSYTTDLIEPLDSPLHTTVLDTVLKPMTAVEGRNRITSTVSGMKYADTLASILNESTSSIKRIDAASRLKQLIGRDIGLNEKVTLTEQDLLNAAYNNTKATQFGYDPMNLPGWVSGTAYGQLAGQFKSYAYNQLGLMFNSTIGELRAGNAGRASRNFLAMMAIYAPTTIAMDAFLAYITGRETKEDTVSMTNYLQSAAGVISGGWADNIIRSPDGKSFVLGIGLGPTGTTIAQMYDATIGSSGVISDALSGDPGAALEDVYKLMQQQGGGAARVIGNITNQTLGF